MTDAAPDPSPGQARASSTRIRDLDDGAYVIQVGADHLSEAIRALVRGDQAAATRFLEYARDAKLGLELMWALCQPNGRIEATVLATPAAGRTAMLFASRPASRDREPQMGNLLKIASEHLPGADITLAQALLDPGATDEHRIFTAGGFTRLANLDYLERPIPRFGSIRREPLPPEVEITTWDPSQREEMCRLLERTYEETLDCPGLTGLRKSTDILDGHLAAGVHIPEWWHILRIEGEPEGVLMFNRGSDGNSIELVYLGLARNARGRGLGRILLANGLAGLDNEQGRAIVLAVDRANGPAVRLYRRFGFRLSVRRVAFVQSIK